MPEKVLLAYNRYQWLGGEHVVHGLDRDLLVANGHEVVDYQRDNAELDDRGPLGRARFAAETIWSPRAKRDVEDLLARERPDVAYFINYFPLITPSAMAACRSAGVPVVLGIHNHRLACPGAFLFRDGQVCEDCIGRRVKWPGVVHGCYRGSRVQTGVVAAMLATHEAAGVWDRYVDVFLALSEFSRDKVVEAGLPEERVVVRPNFTAPDPGPGTPDDDAYAVFVGRLSPEKGVDVLVDAFADLPDVPLRVVGDGPDRPALEARAARLGAEHITFTGGMPHDAAIDLVRGARLLVFPALSYEHCPLVLIEAFACGTPVIASDRGAMTEMVEGSGGALFPPGDAAALTSSVASVWDDHELLDGWRTAARAAFEERYSAEQAYASLRDVFRMAASA